MSSDRKITQTLADVSSGDHCAAAKLMPLVYAELRAVAGRHLRRERKNHTLQATAVVHEAYLKLVDQTRVDWKGKAHFMAVAAEVIRRILVDHARKRGAAKRGGSAARITLSIEDMVATSDSDSDLDLIAVDDALSELAELNERQARVVELRFFGGLSVEETAYALGVSERTVKGDWRVAKAWLRKRMCT